MVGGRRRVGLWICVPIILQPSAIKVALINAHRLRLEDVTSGGEGEKLNKQRTTVDDNKGQDNITGW